MRRLTILSVMCLVIGLAAKSQAALETFDLSWSGASQGNSAIGTGTITFDPSLIDHPGFTILAPTAFSITISDATNSSDDGTFGLADFDKFILLIGTAPLDFSQQLIGQPDYGPGIDGDFNIFSNGTDGNAPDGFEPFTIATGSGADLLVLTSFAPALTPPSGGSSAPLPSGLTLGLLCLGTLALAGRRRGIQAC